MCKHESNKNSRSNNEVDFTGTWEGIRVEGLDDFLCVLKVNMIKRGVAAMVTPTNVIRHEGDQIEVAVELGPVTERVEGTIGGPEFGSKMPIGDKCTRALKWDGNVLVDTMVGEKQSIVARRWMEGSTMVTQATATRKGKSATHTRWYQRSK
eukprot:TRINITY_DN11478_c0_g1_i2.p2 TRINITY_DN11478_c0_g1~~TRINITY_DN11478_c0_g1_i2.p2  ORF type:complete len:152 (-),score=38.03 TRINITY_DN11478_c0_g1_i2:175-630(-)